MNLKAIREKAEQYDLDSQATHIERLERIQSLVETHGVSAVAAAAGLKESSVLQYTRDKKTQISEYTLTKAEQILSSNI